MTSPWLLYGMVLLKNNVNVSSKSNKHKNLIFVGVLKVTDEKRRIRSVSQRHESDIRIPQIRIRIKMSRIRNAGFEGVLDIRYPG